MGVVRAMSACMRLSLPCLMCALWLCVSVCVSPLGYGTRLTSDMVRYQAEQFVCQAQATLLPFLWEQINSFLKVFKTPQFVQIL